MANKIVIKRTTTSGLLPNVSNSSNTSYIAAGELAINLTDRKLLSSNGSATFEIGANLASAVVASTITIGNSSVNTIISGGSLDIGGDINANGSVGSAGQVLTSGGSGNVYWSTTGSGLPGGANTQLQFNDSGSFGGSAAFTFDKTSNTVTVAGNVGIGTSSPTSKLEAMGEIKSSISDGDKTGITIGRVATSRPKLEFNVGDNSARFKFEVNGVNTSEERLGFFAGPLGSSATNEAMTLSGTGNLGIGITTPVNNSGYGGLSINGTSGAIVSMYQGGSETFRITNATGYSFVNTTGATPLLFGTNALERMRITSGGDVGIGTNSPTSFGAGATMLTVAGTSAYGGYLGSTTNVTVQLWANEGALDGRVGTRTNHPFIFTTNNTEKMRLDSAGNVGIGTTSPAYVLNTNYTAPSSFTNAANNFTQMWQTSGTNALGIAISTGDTYARFVVNNGYKFAWNSASTQVMTLSEGGALATVGTMDATSFRDVSNTAYYLDPANTGTSMVVAGNVGIGTTTPGYKLEVNGSFAATTKSFVINHPTKPDMKLRYGSLEGPENGVYVRGRTKGNTIQLPDYWTGLVDEFSITVNLTPIGGYQKLYVKSIDKNVVTIGGGLFDQMEYFYTVFAERKDVDKLIVEI